MQRKLATVLSLRQRTTDLKSTSNSKLIRISKISEQNTVKKIDLNLISKGADLSAFVHSSELVNYVPKTEAIKLRNALMSMDREYKNL